MRNTLIAAIGGDDESVVGHRGSGDVVHDSEHTWSYPDCAFPPGYFFAKFSMDGKTSVILKTGTIDADKGATSDIL